MNPLGLQWRAEQWARFVQAALTGILANPEASARPLSQDAVVEAACGHADAMLEELEKRIITWRKEKP